MSNKGKVIQPARSGETKKLVKRLGLFIVASAFMLYCNTLRHGYVLDDFSVIKDNRVTTQGIKGIPDIFTHFYRYGYYESNDGIYRPLSVVMFAIEWSLSPDHPALSHFINVLLYMLSGWLLFKVLVKLLGKYNLVLPFTITLLFIFHPLHTEVVANIKSRDELLSFLFSFSMIHFLLHYAESNAKSKLLIALLLFFLALLSKETAITMLAIVPLLFFFFSTIEKKKIITIMLSLSAITLLFLIIRQGVLTSDASRHIITPEENLLLFSQSSLEKLATAIKILGYYLKLCIVPHPLLFDYSYNQIPIVNFSDPCVVLSLLVYLGMLIFAIIGLRKKKFLAFASLFYLITISLFSNIFFTIGSAMAERFLYFASLGFCFALSIALLKITKTELINVDRQQVSNLFYKSNKKVLICVCSICLLYSFKTISRNKDWKSNYTLYTHDCKLMDANARAHLYLGNEIIRNMVAAEKDPVRRTALSLEGISELKKSLAIYPENEEAWNTIAAGYMQVDSIDQAAAYFQKAASAHPEDLSNLAGLYLAKGEYKKAIDLYKTITEKNPNFADGFLNMGVCYGTIKEYDQAINAFNKALSLQPNDAKIYYYLCTAYKFKGDMVNYEKNYQEAFRLDPGLSRP